MDRVFRVPAKGREQADLASKFRVVERYRAFVLLAGPAAALEELRNQGYLAEDITDRYAIPGSVDDIDTSQPRLDHEGEHQHGAYVNAEPLPRGRHHYLVQSKGPVKAAWLTAIEAAGGQPRYPYSDFTYVVRASKAAINRIVKLPSVRWVGHLRYADRVSPTVDGV